MLPDVPFLRKTIRLASATSAILLLTFLLHVVIPVNASTIGFIYLITVLAIAASWGLAPAVAASIAATTCFNYFFLPPTYTWTIADPENWVALFTLLASSLVASELSNRANRRAVEATNRQLELQQLYELSRALTLLDFRKPVGKQIAGEVEKIYGTSPVAVYDARTGELAGARVSSALENAMLNPASAGAHNTVEGLVLGSLTLANREVGSLAIQPGALSPAALDALRNLIAVNLEGAHSRGAAARAEAERQSEQFKSTLLDGLAHEFKTPLTSIKAAASALLSGSVRDESQQHELLSIVDQEAQRLSELVTEAIHLARIEAGKIQLKREVHSLSELVRSVLKKTAAARNGRTVDLSIPEDLPQTPIDRELIELAIRQLLDNACKYSDRRSPIRIAMTCRDRKIALAVHNWGEGLSEEERLRVFDKFYRARNAQRLTGAGLGLAVAREIFRAHGGDIQVESSPDTGTEFMALLPCVSPEEIRNEFGAHTGS